MSDKDKLACPVRSVNGPLTGALNAKHTFSAFHFIKSRLAHLVLNEIDRLHRQRLDRARILYLIIVCNETLIIVSSFHGLRRDAIRKIQPI